jgi:hypothetical protein
MQQVKKGYVTVNFMYMDNHYKSYIPQKLEDDLRQ